MGSSGQSHLTSTKIFQLKSPKIFQSKKIFQLRGLQGILQAVDEKGPGLQMPDEQGLRCEQELPQPMPVLPASEVSRHGHEKRQ